MESLVFALLMQHCSVTDTRLGLSLLVENIYPNLASRYEVYGWRTQDPSTPPCSIEEVMG